MADVVPLHYKTITEVAKLLQSKKVSPVDLTLHMLNRIENLDPGFKSYATVMKESAMAAARSAEQEIQAGTYRGALHGVPIAVKDLCFTKGVRTMGGTKPLADNIPDFDATVVTKFETAGAVILGKLNLTEGAMGGYNPDFDIPVNPWNAERWAGASSSGSGVATAAGLCFGSLGSDTGGSIRFPAAACGVVGLKPTWGRVSRYGVLALAESLDHVGPLTRSAADAGIILQVIAGCDSNDPTSLPERVPEMLERIEAGVNGVRIGLDERYVRDGVDSELVKAVLKGVRLLESRGAEIIPVNLPDLEEYLSAWPILCSAEALTAHEATYPSRCDEYGPWFRDWLELGTNVTGAMYAKANNLRAASDGILSQVFQGIDVLVCPSTPEPPFPIDPSLLYGSIEDGGGFDMSMLRFTAPFDFNGAPTISMPCGLNSEGLPLSLQFVGKHLQEALLCRIGHAYEEAAEWNNATPPID